MPKTDRSSGTGLAAQVAPRWWWQVAAILGLGSVLGLAFNSANPVGIRLGKVSGPTNVISAANPAPVSAAVAPPPAQSTGTAPTQTGQPPPTVTAMASPATWQEIKPLAAVGKVVLVDARTRGDFEAGHIPGAILLTEPPGAEQLAAFQKQYPTNSHVVIYCSSTSCSLSFRLANRLVKESGYTFVQYITGGYLEYQRDENSSANAVAAVPSVSSTLPPSTSILTAPSTSVATSPPPPSPVPAPASANSSSLLGSNAFPLTWGQIRPMLETKQVVLVDARPRVQYDTGHIPGAVSLPEASSADELRAAMKAYAEGTRFVCYCSGTGCPEAFRLANRLIREHGAANAQFMIEGYSDWQRLTKPASEQQTAKQ